MSGSRADRLALVGIAAAAVAVTWPLLANLHGLPPDNEDLGLDIMGYYGFAGAARTTVLRFGQFPLRSPWHGGGYPLYANPDDMTLTPTTLLVLAMGPWAAIKIDFVVTYVVAGLGMFLLTRRKMGYSLVAALFSATAFAFGGFLVARWMRGWYVPMRAAWLPLIMYALWRGRQRRRWLASAAALVAWLFIDQKYVAIVMGWFLLMLGLLRLDEEEPAGVGPAWGYFGRLIGVWAFGAGLAAVKLVPMVPLIRGHLGVPRAAGEGSQPWAVVALWLVIFAALGLTPLLGRLVRDRRTRPAGLIAIAAVLASVVAATAFWAPPRQGTPPPAHLWVEEVTDGLVSFGSWGEDEQGDRVPTQRDGYRFSSPVGPVVWLLWVVALFLRPRETWKWALLAALFLFLELGRILPRVLGESIQGHPLLGWIRKPRQHLNFYLFFLLTLLAGRALDWRNRLRRLRALRIAAWVLLGVNVLYLGWNTHARLAYTVSRPLPPAAEWGDYHLLDRAADRWRDQPCFLLRENIGLIAWPLDFRDLRQSALGPSILAAHDGAHRPNPDFEGMVSFNDPVNRAQLVIFTPNRIVVRVAMRRPGVLFVNQIGDEDWRTSAGAVLPDALLLSARLSRVGEYDVRLRYVPRRLYIGLAVSILAALVGGLLLVLTLRRSSPSALRDYSRKRYQVP